MFHMSPDDTGASAVWVAQRVPDDHITVVTNTFRIREITPEVTKSRAFRFARFRVHVRRLL